MPRGKRYLTPEKVLEAGRILEVEGTAPSAGRIAARLGVRHNTAYSYIRKLKLRGLYPWADAPRRGRAIVFGPGNDPVPPAQRRRRRRIDMAAWEASMAEWRAKAGPYIHG
jgi:hypothetical protein